MYTIHNRYQKWFEWITHNIYYIDLNICLKVYLDFVWKSIEYIEFVVFLQILNQISENCTWIYNIHTIYRYRINNIHRTWHTLTHAYTAYVTNPRCVRWWWCADAIPEACRVFGIGARLQFRLLIEALRQNLSVGGGATGSPESLPLI